MRIKRNPGIEQWLYDEIRNNMSKADARLEIHLSDLLSPRRAFWQRILPLPATDLEINYWLTGKGHEGVLSRASGYDHAEAKQWEGIWYTPDFFHNFPSELKTRRRNLAEEGKEAETYDHYLRQLKGYCACENKTHAWLHVWSLVEREKGSWRTRPSFGCYEVDFEKEELEEEKIRLRKTRDLLAVAIASQDHRKLPLCDSWMCGRFNRETVRKPHCVECNKDFENDLYKKHTQAKAGKNKDGSPHTIIEPEYKFTYEPMCKWFDKCLDAKEMEAIQKGQL